MRPCHSCQTVVNEYILDKELEVLRDLTVDDFSPCTDCTIVATGACVRYGDDIYVPRGETTVPDYCPVCRTDLIRRAGSDPGWTCDAIST